jgi:predicted Fe-Mo cluster-binding NifX family protein
LEGQVKIINLKEALKMKIAISSRGKDLDSPIDPHFGRCAYFLIVETDDMSFEALNNENRSLGGGAGIQSAQLVSSKGAKAILTGYCGPNAVRTLSAAGIELYVVQKGTVKEAVEKYVKGELNPTKDANVTDHFGLDRAGYRTDTQSLGFGGRSMGMGRGMGFGRGGGRGRRMG